LCALITKSRKEGEERDCAGLKGRKVSCGKEPDRQRVFSHGKGALSEGRRKYAIWRKKVIDCGRRET